MQTFLGKQITVKVGKWHAGWILYCQAPGAVRLGVINKRGWQPPHTPVLLPPLLRMHICLLRNWLSNLDTFGANGIQEGQFHSTCHAPEMSIDCHNH